MEHSSIWAVHDVGQNSLQNTKAMPWTMAQPLGPSQKPFWVVCLVGYWTTEIRENDGQKMVLDLQSHEVNPNRAHGKEQIHFAGQKSLQS